MQFSIMATGWQTNPDIMMLSRSVLLCQSPLGRQHTGLLCLPLFAGVCSTHVHWVDDVIQPSHPLSSPSPALNLSQHQGLFQWVSSSHQVAQSIGSFSISISPSNMNIQDWFPLGWTGWISLQSKGLSRVFSSATVQRHQFFSTQYFLLSSSHIYAAAKSLQSCPTLCDPIDGSPPGSPVPGILQARIPEWVAISFSNASKWKMKVKSLSHVRPLDCSLPGSSVHGIFQARVLEWGAIAFPIYTWLLKNHSFDYMDLCWQSTLIFNMLSRFVTAFLPRSKCLLFLACSHCL